MVWQVVLVHHDKDSVLPHIVVAAHDAVTNLIERGPLAVVQVDNGFFLVPLQFLYFACLTFIDCMVCLLLFFCTDQLSRYVTYT